MAKRKLCTFVSGKCEYRGEEIEDMVQIRNGIEFKQYRCHAQDAKITIPTGARVTIMFRKATVIYSCDEWYLVKYDTGERGRVKYKLMERL